MSTAGAPASSEAPSPEDPLSINACRRHVAEICGLPSPGPTVGAEVEWLVVDQSDPLGRPSVDELRQLLEGLTLSGGSQITFEPGGQLELSGPPGRTPAEAVAPISTDSERVNAALASCGWRLEARACDQRREPRRVNGLPRYGEMEQWFTERGWRTAQEMMCNTAAVQVNLGCGPDPSTSWSRSNRMAAPLAAAFAASPGEGWASRRLRSWAGLDPSRTRSAFDTGDPVEDWTNYALNALAMLRYEGDDIVRVPCKTSFAEWVEGNASIERIPTLADFDLHLSTLFPPVRLKGWLEMRVFDVPANGDWPVPVGVVAALLTGPELDNEDSLLGPVDHLDWTHAAQTGLEDPGLRAAANGLVTAAIERLEESASPLASQVAGWWEERS